MEFLLAFGDQDAICALDDLSCLSSCDSLIDWAGAHCACDTGALFASYSFDFAGETYCCGDESCQNAIETFYASAFGMSEEMLELYLGQGCGDGVSCESGSLSYSHSHSYNAPSPMPTVMWAAPSSYSHSHSY